LQNESFATALFFAIWQRRCGKKDMVSTENRIAKPRLSCFCLPFVDGLFYLLKPKLLGLQKGGFEDDFLSILPTAFSDHRLVQVGEVPSRFLLCPAEEICGICSQP